MNIIANHGYAVIAVVAGTFVGFGPAYAQESGKVMIDVADCIKLAAPEARLACYESRVAAVFGERAAQAAAAQPPATPAVSPTAPTRAAEPALAAPAAAATPPAPPPPAARTVAASSTESATPPAQARSDRPSRRDENDRGAADAADIVSRVKDLREVLPNAWQVTLENGQVWRQTVSKHYELRPGAQVRIYTTHWGSAMRLSTEDLNGYIQVERVH